MTKADLQNLINTNLATASDITAFELRAVEDAFLNEIYSGFIEDTHLTTNVFTKQGLANFTYNLKIKKVGNLAYVNGSLTNTSTNLLQGFLIRITNPIFYNLSNVVKEFQINSGSNGQIIVTDVNEVVYSNYLLINTPIPINGTAYINFTYLINE